MLKISIAAKYGVPFGKIWFLNVICERVHPKPHRFYLSKKCL